MTRKDYEAVARGIRASQTPVGVKREVAGRIADEIERDRGNSSFDRGRFLRAATGFPESR